MGLAGKGLRSRTRFELLRHRAEGCAVDGSVSGACREQI